MWKKFLNEDIIEQERNVEQTFQSGPLPSIPSPIALLLEVGEKKLIFAGFPYILGNKSTSRRHLRNLEGSSETDCSAPSFPLMFLQGIVVMADCTLPTAVAAEIPVSHKVVQEQPIYYHWSELRWHVSGVNGMMVASWLIQTLINTDPVWSGSQEVTFVTSWLWPRQQLLWEVCSGSSFMQLSWDLSCHPPNDFRSTYFPIINLFLFKIGWLLTTTIKLLLNQKKEGMTEKGKDWQVLLGDKILIIHIY